MKTIVEINSTNYASTGNIMANIAKEARKTGYRVYTCCKDSRESRKHLYDDQIFVGFRIERIISETLSYLTGLRDHFNLLGTCLFIRKLKRIRPDLIHLHTMHDTFINTGMLFRYIKKNSIPVVWTFHDSCAFTGQCPYFETVQCEKWKTGCHHCPQTDVVPKSLVDSTRYIWNKKKKWIFNVKELTVVTPSEWLKKNVEESIFKQYPVRVINNGIDLNAFKPVDTDFRKKHDLENKYILLGVANRWSRQKGLNSFIELSRQLPDQYQIVMVGTNDEIDQLLPDGIISIHRTYDQKELVQIYSSADLFVNPTLEENFPTVNIEALACGLPVVTYRTGGSPETLDENCGSVVEKGNLDQLKEEIIRICETKPYSKESCVSRAQQFDMNQVFKNYVKLYDEVIS